MKKIQYIYTTRVINLISLIISIIIFLIINFFINNFNSLKDIHLFNDYNVDVISNVLDENKIEMTSQNSLANKEDGVQDTLDWYIEIQSINLKAPIKESVDNDVLGEYVGHFIETDLTTGNIGLAAHNRGYKNNYFQNLKNVKMGDEIRYFYKEYACTYVIDTIEIIRNTDWSYLEKYEEDSEDKITLITCVENEPTYRRCVQATEKQNL